jgi:hypothetical protein
MDYNTKRKLLVLPEYGRNVHKMVNIIKETEDRDERNRLAKATIQLMGAMNPHLRDVADFKHKLWDHLAIISDFELDVDSPYPTPTKAELEQKPDRLKYFNSDEIGFKHYGRVVEDMIRRATQYPEGEEKDYLIEVIGNQMKKSYLAWNRETVSDELIFSDMQSVSGHRLNIPEGLKLKDSKDLLPKQPATNSSLKKPIQKKRKMQQR